MSEVDVEEEPLPNWRQLGLLRFRSADGCLELKPAICVYNLDAWFLACISILEEEDSLVTGTNEFFNHNPERRREYIWNRWNDQFELVMLLVREKLFVLRDAFFPVADLVAVTERTWILILY